MLALSSRYERQMLGANRARSCDTTPTMLITATGTAAAVLLAAPLSALALLRRMHASVGTAPPTAAMLAEERATDCALFRHFPPLRQKLAWRSLGAIPTAVHRGAVTDPISGRRLSFEVKREDLISSEYGGNKVRTLQHQLAVCEAKIERASSAAERARLENLLVIGTGGSNQVVATLVHAGRAKLANVNVAWLQPDQPDLDNSLNMLSTLSLPLGGSRGTWGRPAPMAAELLRACLGGGVALPLGGNNPSGVLGQAGGALELAEQIERGEATDPDRLYLAVGSSCTISGLVVGVALSRRLGLAAFRSDSFTIVGVIVHHLFAAAERSVGLHTAPWARAVPLTTGHSVRAACAELAALGGPDVTAEALELLARSVAFHHEPQTVGTYGGHSERSRAAARAYDATGSLADARGAPAAPPLWLCGHFVAKAFAAMLEDLRAAPEGARYLLWQTKSAVQPRGAADEWAAMRAMPAAVRRWADGGAAESSARPGRVDTERGAAEEYRPLMTRLGDD